MEVVASGIRNTVGFDWHPESKELWFTENGRDMLGDDVPPDELNHAPRANMHFGYPYCHGGDIADPEYGSKRRCAEFTPPAQKFGAQFIMDTVDSVKRRSEGEFDVNTALGKTYHAPAVIVTAGGTPSKRSGGFVW